MLENFIVQIVGFLVIVAVLLVARKVRKPKAGEKNVGEITSVIAINRMTVVGPMLMWLIAFFVAVMPMFLLDDFSLWLLLVVLGLPLAIYFGLSMKEGFGMMTKRNFIDARLAYMKDPKGFNAIVLNTPIVERRLGFYPKAMRKFFIFLADAKWF